MNFSHLDDPQAPSTPLPAPFQAHLRHESTQFGLPLTPQGNCLHNHHHQQADEQQRLESLLSHPQPPVLKFTEIKRNHKPNPVLMSTADLRTKRRNMFLDKLKCAREHSRIQARGGEDEMMRMIFVSEHQQWYADLARTAASIPTIEEETECQLLWEDDNPYYSDLVEEQDRELEAILSQLDLHDDKLEGAHGNSCQAGNLSQTPQHVVAICGSCGAADSTVPLDGVRVCFCCGWSPQ